MKEIFPFVNMTWNTRKLKDKWVPILQDINHGDLETQFEMIKRGYRQANSYGFTTPRFDEEMIWLSERGLIALPIHRTQLHKGYDHRFYMKNKIDMETYVYSAVSDTYDSAKQFKDHHLLPDGTDHKEVGAMLGYPDCCVEKFLGHWPTKADPTWDLAAGSDGAEVAENTVHITGNKKLNNLARAFGFKVCGYYVGDYNCPEAIKFADKWIECMESYVDSESMEMLLELLDSPMTWSMKNGIIEVRTEAFRGATNGYFTDEKKVIYWNQP